MKTSKLFLFVAAFVLLASLSAGAMAQGAIDANGWISPFPTPEPIVPVVSVNAVEITDGIIGFDNQTRTETMFGYSFMGRTTGSFPGSLTLSMNCAPAIAIPGEASRLTGGTWTLPVYMTPLNGGYAGSLYGTIAKGVMEWDRTGTNANVYIVLTVSGGTQSWDRVEGYAVFTGALSVDEKTQKTALNGDLVFNIMIPTIDSPPID